jgi:hypothetical protein
MAQGIEISFEEMQQLVNGKQGQEGEKTESAYKSISMEEMKQLLQKKEKFELPAEKFAAGLPGALQTMGGTPPETVLETPDKEEAAALARYGPTVAATMMTGGLSFLPSVLVNAGVVGASELTARQIERGVSSPEGKNALEDLKAAGSLALVDAGLSTVGMGSLKLLGKVGAGIAKSRFGESILQSRKVFKNNIERTAAKKLSQEVSKLDDPFELTIAELSREDGGLVAALDDFASSGTGAGTMKKFRKNRLQAYHNTIDSYYEDLLNKGDKHDLAAFVRQALGDVRDPGFIIRPADAYKKHLYHMFDEEMVRNHSSATLNMSHVRKYLLNAKNVEALKGYREVARRYVELLPPLKATKKLSEKELAEQWKRIPVKNVEKAYRQINQMIKNAKAANLPSMNQAGDLVKQMKEPFERYVEKQPELYRLWSEAKNFKGAQAEALNNKLIFKIRDKLAEEPAAVAELFKVTKENAAVAHDNLIRFKEALDFAGNNSRALSKSIPPGDAEAFNFLTPRQARQYYDENILQPLRFSFLKKTVTEGKLDGAKLLGLIEDVEKASSKYLPELFGGTQQVDNLKALGRVLQEAQMKPKPSIFIQLKTAGAVSGIGAATYVFSDDPKIKTLGATALAGSAAILLSPYALAKVITQPGLTRQLVDGIKRSPTFLGTMAPQLLGTMRRISEMKTAETFFKNNPSSGALQYYTLESLGGSANE